MSRLRLPSAFSFWVVAGLALGLSLQVLWERYWIVAFFPVALWVMVGIGFLVIPFSDCFSSEAGQKEARLALKRLVLVLGSVALFFVANRVGAGVAAQARFATNEDAYQRVVELLETRSSEKVVETVTIENIYAIVDRRDQLRVAFPWPGGVVDNWCGAVFDPTAVVLQANDFDGDWLTWSDQVPNDVVDLFGGDLLSCETLSTNYYHCCFT